MKTSHDKPADENSKTASVIDFHTGSTRQPAPVYGYSELFGDRTCEEARYTLCIRLAAAWQGKTPKQVLAAAGGEASVRAAIHLATGLRVNLRETYRSYDWLSQQVAPEELTGKFNTLVADLRVEDIKEELRSIALQDASRLCEANAKCLAGPHSEQPKRTSMSGLFASTLDRLAFAWVSGFDSLAPFQRRHAFQRVQQVQSEYRLGQLGFLQILLRLPESFENSFVAQRWLIDHELEDCPIASRDSLLRNSVLEARLGGSDVIYRAYKLDESFSVDASICYSDSRRPESLPESLILDQLKKSESKEGPGFAVGKAYTIGGTYSGYAYCIAHANDRIVLLGVKTGKREVVTSEELQTAILLNSAFEINATGYRRVSIPNEYFGTSG